MTDSAFSLRSAAVVWLSCAVMAVATVWPAAAQVDPGQWTGPLDAFLQDREADGFAGAVLIEQNGEVVFSRGYGYANREEKIPWSAETVTTIGSITKPMTASAIVKLHVEGKLSVQDTIDRWIPGLSADKAQITLHDLLTHSAGVPDSFGGDFDKHATRDWFLQRFRDCKLLWGPDEFGKRYQYSNAGFTLLAIVIEEVTVQSYEQYLHDTFFAPLGMTQTGYTIPEWKPGQFAHGYVRDKDWGVVALKHALPDGPSWNLIGNGGIHSTLNDMRKWHRAMVDYDVFTPEMIRLMETPYVRESPQASMFRGYGWGVMLSPRNTRIVRHNGGNGIFFADFKQFPDENTLILLASNVAEQSGQRYVGRIMRFVFEGE